MLSKISTGPQPNAHVWPKGGVGFLIFKSKKGVEGGGGWVVVFTSGKRKIDGKSGSQSKCLSRERLYVTDMRCEMCDMWERRYVRENIVDLDYRWERWSMRSCKYDIYDIWEIWSMIYVLHDSHDSWEGSCVRETIYDIWIYMKAMIYESDRVYYMWCIRWMLSRKDMVYERYDTCYILYMREIPYDIYVI
jgi:hypothetical protein